METLRNIELTPLPGHSSQKARKAKEVPLKRSPTKKATLKRSPLRAANGMINTRAQREAVTKEEASQEAKDHTEVIITLITKEVAVGMPLRAKSLIRPVIGPENKQPVVVDDQKSEEVTPTVTHQLQQETTGVNLVVNNLAGALDAADPSVEEEEAQGEV